MTVKTSTTISISAKDYGARGNDTTNDTAAIQAAITAAIAAGIDMVYPPGTYLISSGGILGGTVTHRFERGAKLHFATDITFAGKIEAAQDQQIFDIDMGVTVTPAAGSTQTVYPEWFGGIAYPTDSTRGIQLAIDWIRDLGGGTVRFAGFIYGISDTLFIGDGYTTAHGVILEGEGGQYGGVYGSRLAWVGALNDGPILSVRNAHGGAIKHISFFGNVLSNICLQMNSEIGDLYGCQNWEIRNCMFWQSRYANVVIGYPDGYSQATAGDITNVCFYDCMFLRDPSNAAPTVYHVRQRNWNAVGIFFVNCRFDGPGTGAPNPNPSYFFGVQSGHIGVYGGAWVGSGLFDVLGDYDPEATVPGRMSVYGLESQSDHLFKLDVAGAPAAAQYPWIFSGVYQAATVGEIGGGYSCELKGYNQNGVITFDGCRFVRPMLIENSAPYSTWVQLNGVSFANAAGGTFDFAGGATALNLAGWYFDNAGTRTFAPGNTSISLENITVTGQVNVGGSVRSTSTTLPLGVSGSDQINVRAVGGLSALISKGSGGLFLSGEASLGGGGGDTIIRSELARTIYLSTDSLNFQGQGGGANWVTWVNSAGNVTANAALAFRLEGAASTSLYCNNLLGFTIDSSGDTTVKSANQLLIQCPVFRLQDATTTVITLSLANAGSTSITAEAAVTSFTITQSDLSTNSATGATTTLKAQNATGTTSTGGKLSLASGTGTITHGTIELATGTTVLGIYALSVGSTDFRFTLGATMPYFVFAANGSTQQLFFQSTGGSGAINFQSGSVVFADAAAANTISFVLAATGATSATIATGVTGFTLKQADKTANGETGAALTIQAQNETGTTSTGGALIFQTGTGTTTAGAIQFKAGATLLGSLITDPSGGPYTEFVLGASQSGFIFQNNATNQFCIFQAIGSGGGVYVDTATSFFIRDPSGGGTTALSISPISSGTTTVQYAASVTAATINQADKTANSGTGATMTIQAQNETGTTSTGGNLILASGTGTSTNGSVLIKAGSTTIQTFTTSTAAYNSGILVSGSGTWIHLVRTGDQTVTASTTLVDDDTLQFAIAANEAWVVEVHIAEAASVGGGGRDTITAPSGATGLIEWDVQGAGAGGTYGALGTEFTHGAGTTNNVNMKVWITNSSTAGTVKVRFAQSVNDGNSVIHKAGSYLRAWRVA